MASQQTLDKVIVLIRESIDEDWIEDFDIDFDTSFNQDLELESIEFVSIAGRIQQHFGKDIDFIDWLSTLELDALIKLTVGELADFIENNGVKT